MVTRARSYHELSYEDKLAHWRQNKKPSRWPQLLAAISYAEKLIECYDFEECDWAVLTEKPGHVFGSAMCCMQGQVMINVDSNREEKFFTFLKAFLRSILRIKYIFLRCKVFLF